MHDLTERLRAALRASSDRGGEEKTRLLELLRSHAVERRAVKLSSGRDSDFYFDCRRVTLLDEGVHLAASLLLRAMAADDVSPAAVAGPIASGIPLVTAISLIRRSLRLTALARAELLDTLDVQRALGDGHGARDVIERLLPSLPVLAVRLKPRDHGLKCCVEGLVNVKPDSVVALVDDVASTGASLLDAIRILLDSHLKVAWVGCLVDRQEGARECLAEQGHELRALFTGQEVVGG
jgi:orotate phosphoribosyltransferase